MKWDRYGVWDDRVQTSIADSDFRGALEALVQGYQSAVVGFCVNLLGDVNQGEEVAQEVFLAAYKAMPRFRQQASIRTWLFAIARKRCFKAFRDRGRRERKQSEQKDAILEGAHANPQKTPEEGLLEAERLKRLKRSLNSLEKGQRAALIMRYETGLQIAEIANILGISVPTTHRRLAQALQQLRKEMDR